MSIAGSRTGTRIVAPVVVSMLTLLSAGSSAALAGLENLVVEEVEQAFLGVMISGQVAEGIGIHEIVEGSAAEAAGLEARDVIVGLDGNRFERGDSLQDEIRSRQPGERLSLTVLRDGQEIALQAELGLRRQLRLELDEPFFVVGPHMRGRVRGTFVADHARASLDEIYVCRGDGCRFSTEKIWYRLDCLQEACPTYRVNFMRRPMLGVELIPTTDELRQHFGSDPDTGLLVGRVLEGSPAEQGGVEVGDLIVSLDGEPTGSGCDVRRALKDRAGSVVEVGVLRDGRSLALDVSIPELAED